STDDRYVLNAVIRNAHGCCAATVRRKCWKTCERSGVDCPLQVGGTPPPCLHGGSKRWQAAWKWIATTARSSVLPTRAATRPCRGPDRGEPGLAECTASCRIRWQR